MDKHEMDKADQLAAIVESSDDAIISKSLEGVITSWNAAAERLFGYPAAEMIGQSIIKLLPADRLDEERLILERLRRGERVNHFETVRRAKDGRLLDISLTISPIRNSRGEVIGASKIARDISARKQLEAALQEREERLRMALEAGRMGTWEWNLRTQEVIWSPGLEALHGLAPGTFPGTFAAYEQDIHPDDREHILRSITHTLETGRDHHIEYRLRWADGSIHWVEGRGKLFRDEAGAPIRMMGVCTDISARKRAEEALRDADRRKDEFLALLAHELRNPLGPIRNAVQVLTLTGAQEPNTQRAYEMIERQVRHMTRLIDDLLDLSRIARGKISLRKEPLELTRLVRQTAEDYRSLLAASGLTLALDLPEGPLWVEGDAVRLAQLLGNLLHNAHKFTDPGGQVVVQISVVGEWASVRVRDTGIGMEPAVLAHVFEAFSQAEQGLSRSRGGLGLGLALVKGLAELHGGRVEAASTGSGQGAEFTVRLPLRAAPPKAASLAPAGDEASLASVAAEQRVLIIEDNRDAADSLALLLTLTGYAVRAAYTGKAGLDAAREFRPQMVLCDIGLPDLDGYEVARRLRTEEPLNGVYLIALTGYGRDEDQRRAREAGFDLHLTKPVDPEALRQTLTRLKVLARTRLGVGQ